MNNSQDDIRPFPIQAECPGSTGGRSFIPWWLAEIAYEWYASQYGTRQSLDRIAERGGFGRQELVCLLQHCSTNKRVC